MNRSTELEFEAPTTLTQRAFRVEHIRGLKNRFSPLRGSLRQVSGFYISIDRDVWRYIQPQIGAATQRDQKPFERELLRRAPLDVRTSLTTPFFVPVGFDRPLERPSDLYNRFANVNTATLRRITRQIRSGEAFIGKIGTNRSYGVYRKEPNDHLTKLFTILEGSPRYRQPRPGRYPPAAGFPLIGYLEQAQRNPEWPRILQRYVRRAIRRYQILNPFAARPRRPL